MAIHNFKVGDKVTVFNATASGQYFIEGKATILKTIGSGEDYYRVQFDSKAKATRYVDPNGQDNPDDYLTKLNLRDSAIWS